MKSTSGPFSHCSEEYRQYRPDYPAELFDHLIEQCTIDTRSRVLDVGAGTGKASAPLIARGIPVLSVEPNAAMIREGRVAYPECRYLCSTAECLPVQSGAISLVTAAQCFHRFDTDAALTEFHRVLQPSGHLALVWYGLDPNQAHTREILKAVANASTEPATLDQGVRHDWPARIEASGHFRMVGHRQFHTVVPMEAEDWIGLARTIPYLRGITDTVEPLLREVLSRQTALDAPYLINLWLARRHTT